MTVADLQLFLGSLGGALLSSGAKQVATEIQDLSHKLDVFRGMKLPLFTEFLIEAEAYKNNRPIPQKKASARSAKSSVDPETLNRAIATAKHLLNSATDHNLTVQEIENQLQQFNDLTKPQLESIAQAIDITTKFKSKLDALAKIKKFIVDQKGFYERSQV